MKTALKKRSTKLDIDIGLVLFVEGDQGRQPNFKIMLSLVNNLPLHSTFIIQHSATVASYIKSGSLYGSFTSGHKDAT